MNSLTSEQMSRLKNYLKEKEIIEKQLSDLQEKYGIYEYSDYEEEIDYDFEENPFVSGGQIVEKISLKDGDNPPIILDSNFLPAELFLDDDD